MAYSALLERIVSISERNLNRKSVGEQKVSVGSGAVVTLTLPTTAAYALLVVEDGGSANTAKSLRFYESGTAPTAANGIPLGDLDAYEIIGPDCLANFKMIGIEAGKTHTVQIIYYR